MKKLLFLFVLAMILATLPACDENKELIIRADRIAAVVEAVVTDPEIRPKIPEDTMEYLIDLKKVYGFSRDVILNGGVDSGAAKDILVGHAEKLIDLLSTLPMIDKYADQIKSARLAIEVLKALISPG